MHELHQLIGGEIPAVQPPETGDYPGQAEVFAYVYAFHIILLLLKQSRGGVLAHIQRHSGDNDEALDNQLPVGVEADEGQAVADDGKDNNTDDGAGDLAHAAAEGHAATTQAEMASNS